MTRMPFGKQSGRLLSKLPREYLEWLCQQDFLREPLASRVRAEYDRRESSQADKIIINPEIADELIGAGLRVLAKKHHPDACGDHEKMVAINAAADWLRNQARALPRILSGQGGFVLGTVGVSA